VRLKLFLLTSLLIIIAAAGARNVVADYRSTFLIGASQYSTLSWLSDGSSNIWREKVIEKLKLNGDTHADVMARNHDPMFKVVDGVNRVAWRDRLNKLRDKNLAPVMWLISDDSPQVYKQGLQSQIDYQNEVVDAVDDLVSHYVVCLECDEYYSPQEVSVLIQNLIKKGVNKPIGVHLTPGVKPEYYKDADVIYLQTGFGLSEAQFRESIQHALSLGKPVVVSEYSLEGTSEQAKRFGDIACQYPGVVGTGNGRGSSTCASMVWNREQQNKSEWERWEDFVKKNDEELYVFALALVTISAANLIQLPFMATFNYATENYYELMMVKPITETIDTGVTVRNDGKVMIFGNWRFK
jgi:hypothetical protein